MRLRLATLHVLYFPLGKASHKNIADTKTSINRFLAGLVFCSRFLIEQVPKMALTTSASRLPLHVKARGERYPNSDVKRFPVPDDKVQWSVPWPEYKPVEFTNPKVLAGPVWADPEIRGPNSVKLKFNRVDGKINRRSHMKPDYETPEGVPRNPCGRTGITGRGELGKWGPNHAADPLVTRWKRDESGTEVVDPVTKKKILQFIAICRKDSGAWAIPGGMVDAGETVSVTLRREFGEEAMNSLDAPRKERKKIEKAVGELFKHGIEVYRGYVDDPRNTDNSWMETIAVNFHDGTGNSVGKFALHAGDDAGAVQWTDIGSNLKLFASHESFIEKVAIRLDAHW
ncbi:ADP-ribose pyrophosphatase, mitochondrial-like [Acanthaster planci]|uniref:ADP-ribose pyrophosphatase, mitochondrial-like n=1 Tax=Acanthaster planci TaxID=133434 RepID=A0A8B7ZD20_ACAPL|nr:ADP-ribose pyrophosphatase, mitochondrial-like [Acanthaster planci]